METVKISGITYQVIKRVSQAEMAEKHPNVANLMKENNVQQHVELKRPRGKKAYLTTVVNGHYTDVIPLI